MNQAVHARRFGVKVHVRQATESPVDLEPYIGVFQRWIQQGALEELMIDVADYRHVPQGPGILLVCHAAHYSLDSGDGQLGLRFEAKRDEPDEVEGRLKRAFVSALRAANLLEQTAGAEPLRFSGEALDFHIQDRLAAPNDDATFEQLRPLLQQLADKLYPGGSATVERLSEDGRRAFAVRLRGSAAAAPEIATLLERAQQLPEEASSTP